MCRLQNKKHYHTMLFHNNTTAYNFLEAHQLLRISGAYKKGYIIFSGAPAFKANGLVFLGYS